MINIQTQIRVKRLSGPQVFDFLINPTDAAYHQWWPGIGKRRVKMKSVVIKANPGKQIIWQMQKLIRLPVWLTLELEDDKEGVTITHTITAGFNGLGKKLDIFLRLYFSLDFENAMDEHVRIEFPLLRDLLLAHELR